jgi:hypothetical protein
MIESRRPSNKYIPITGWVSCVYIAARATVLKSRPLSWEKSLVHVNREYGSSLFYGDIYPNVLKCRLNVIWDLLISID